MLSAFLFVFLSTRPSCWETNSWRIQASAFLTAHFLSDDRIIMLLMFVFLNFILIWSSSVCQGNWHTMLIRTIFLSWKLDSPFLWSVHMESSFNNCGPLQTSDNERVGFWPFSFHQLAFYNEGNQGEVWGKRYDLMLKAYRQNVQLVKRLIKENVIYNQEHILCM